MRYVHAKSHDLEFVLSLEIFACFAQNACEPEVEPEPFQVTAAVGPLCRSIESIECYMRMPTN